MKNITPTEAQFLEFSNAPDEGPLVMINLLKFKRDEKNSLEQGLAAYDRYGKQVFPLLEKAGAKVLWLGAVDQVVIGASADEWDRVMIVEYPSRKAFSDMISMPEYGKVHDNRDAALENSALLASSTLYSLLGNDP
jgi:uncharacterized protein (DUF1330 family)